MPCDNSYTLGDSPQAAQQAGSKHKGGSIHCCHYPQMIWEWREPKGWSCREHMHRVLGTAVVGGFPLPALSVPPAVVPHTQVGVGVYTAPLDLPLSPHSTRSGLGLRVHQPMTARICACDHRPAPSPCCMAFSPPLLPPHIPGRSICADLSRSQTLEPFKPPGCVLA